MTEIDKLRILLTDSDIPHESIIQLMNYDIYINADKTKGERYKELSFEWYGEAAKYSLNQVVYGRTSRGSWMFDAIWQKGSYGAKKGLIETYGQLGQIKGEPQIMTANEAYEIIVNHWNRLSEDTKKKYRERIEKIEEEQNK